MIAVKRLPAHEVSEFFVLQKVEFFIDLHLWPERQILNPYGWLGNFTSAERPLAVHILNIFLFFNEILSDALLRSVVQSISVDLAARATSLAEAKAMWRSFLSTLIVSYVHGERPQATDSGHLFARKARQILDIPDAQILEPADAIAALLEKSEGTLLLLDDFVGSGRQMEASWTRVYAAADGKRGSMRMLNENGIRVIYTPLVSTAYGLGELRRSCPGLEVRPAHELDARYSLTHPDSILWPEALKTEGRDFLHTASARAGIVANAKYGWEGFHNLALALGFWHSVPDATLPLFYWEEQSWVPLIRRT
jgi:hypothetical protein